MVNSAPRFPCTSLPRVNSSAHVPQDDGRLVRLLPVASEEDIRQFGYLFLTQLQQDFCDSHTWLSIYARSLLWYGRPSHEIVWRRPLRGDTLMDFCGTDYYRATLPSNCVAPTVTGQLSHKIVCHWPLRANTPKKLCVTDRYGATLPWNSVAPKLYNKYRVFAGPSTIYFNYRAMPGRPLWSLKCHLRRIRFEPDASLRVRLFLCCMFTRAWDIPFTSVFD